MSRNQISGGCVSGTGENGLVLDSQVGWIDKSSKNRTETVGEILGVKKLLSTEVVTHLQERPVS